MTSSADAPKENVPKPEQIDAKSKEEGESASSLLRAELQIPAPVIAEYQTSQQKGARRDRWKLIAEWLTVLLVGGYGLVASFQWREMRESNRVNKEALVSVQRAFVTFSPDISPFYNLAKESSTKIRAWQFLIPMTNSGSTPTQEMLHHVIVHPSIEELTKNFNFHDFENGQHGLIGPKDRILLVTDPLDVETIVAVENKTKHVYVHGWTTYRDVFQGTRLHVTKFCYELDLGGGDVTDVRSRVVWRFDLCSVHNCSDEDCDKAR